MNEKEVEEKKVERVSPIKPAPVVKPQLLTKPVITDEAILKALKKAGGSAQITPLYDAFDKTGFEKVEPSSLKTKLRTHSKKMVEEGKIQATHVDGKRQFEFVLNNTKSSK